jgi:lysophospholipase
MRRLVRLEHAVPQVLLGHSFGALVALRYLETQPSDPLAATVLSSPWLATARPAPLAKRAAAKVLGDLWPSLRFATGLDARRLSHDPAVASAYETDPAVHGVITAGAWREIQWAQRAVPADGYRIEGPLLFLLAGADAVVDAARARAFADALHTGVEIRSYPELYHEVLNEPEAERVAGDVLGFLAGILVRAC